MADRIASVRLALARELGQPLLQLFGGVVDDAGELAELVFAPYLDAGREIAARVLPRGVHDLGERAAERGREGKRDEDRGGERERERQRCGAPQLAALRRDAVEPAAEARDPLHPARGGDRHRRIQQLDPDGRAPALGPGDLAGKRAHDLRPASVVLELLQLCAGNGGVREHAAVRSDDRDPRVDVARRRVDRGVELVLGRATGEGVLDDAGHQPGLRGQAGEGVVASPPLEGRARPDEQHREHDGGRHHGRRHHPSAQRQPSLHSPASRAIR